MIKKTWMRNFADEINFLRAERGNIRLTKILAKMEVDTKGDHNRFLHNKIEEIKQ